MATSADEDYEYEYDDEAEEEEADDDDQNRNQDDEDDDEEEDDDDDDDYPVEEDDDIMNDTNTSMDWDPSENPNAAPMHGRKGKRITASVLRAVPPWRSNQDRRNHGRVTVDVVLISTRQILTEM
jgi:hypothetical protein